MALLLYLLLPPSEVFESVWEVVDPVNKAQSLRFNIEVVTTCRRTLHVHSRESLLQILIVVPV